MNLISDTEIGLISRIKKGDQEAFQDIYLKFYEPLCFFAISYTRDKVVAEDIVQDVFANIWDNRSDFKIKTSLKSYLYRATYNRFIDLYRKDFKRNDMLEKIRYEIVMHNSTNESQEDDVMEKIKSIEVAVEKLPPKCREIFMLSKVNGMKYKQIAEKLEISLKTVENQIGIAYSKIRNMVQN